MALTLSLLGEDGEAIAGLSLTVDAPRIVIGRSKSCEVLLLDPSVSARHATIRREGGRNLIIDEGSTNGITIDNVVLPAQTPRVIRDGERVRIGRVWLRLGLVAGIPSPSGSRERFALELLRRDLEKEGEPLHAELRVTAGPDRGARLALTDSDRDYRIGRSREADLVLRDDLVSRLHVLVSQRRGKWHLHDNGSKRGSALGDEALGNEPTLWRRDLLLTMGSTIVALHDPLPAAQAAALAAPDLPMRPEEREQPPPGADAEPEPATVPAPEADADITTGPISTPAAPAPIHAPRDPKGAGYLSVDVLVVLVALGVIGLSMAALWWVLG